ncbi:hypothetical protein [Bacillus sp. REN10]|uniref:helix-turn-helix domain-containing protein n=1 Tax=Bacillus sp. REN10 TaxID=2782541 RepID=UPI00193C5491|nr:hypothetical protein [Bacillus sp. REN10]
MEQAYFSSEVAKSLGVGASTLRKYSLALEAAGYHFDRGINNSRVFYQKDIIAMQRIFKAVQDQNMSMEAAIELAVKQQQEDLPAQINHEPVIHDEPLLSKIAKLEEQQQTLIEVNKELVKELAQYQRWMREKIESIEHKDIEIRDRLLLANLQNKQVKREVPVYHLSSFFAWFKRKKNAASFN